MRPAHLMACCPSMNEPDNGQRTGVDSVARVLRRLLFVTWIVLGLVFAAVCYAQMFGFFQFD
jgi:hypothetical protein